MFRIEPSTVVQGAYDVCSKYMQFGMIKRLINSRLYSDRRIGYTVVEERPRKLSKRMGTQCGEGEGRSTQNNNLHRNVGALCKMSAPYVKCRRLKCWRPMQNVGSLKCRRLLKMSALMKYSKFKKQLRLTQIILSPRSNCTCTKYSTNICAYMKCWRPVKHVCVS